MQVGVIFPQTEIGADRGAVREYATAVSGFGYGHIAAYDHVVGADPAVHEGWDRPYDIRTTFHEPIVLFGYLAALTPLELVSSILILPQRQTVLVAKQAAEIDLLTGGKFRLGVGLGWNEVEYEALGMEFANRGARAVEQVALLRALWTEESVTFTGQYEKVTGAGLSPLPIQRPIPVWFGGSAKVALRRVGRIADGWFPAVQPGPELAEAIAVVHGAAREAGRDPAAIGIEGRVSLGAASPEETAEQAAAWREAGATHLSVNTMGAGFATVADHLAALGAAAETLLG